MAKIRVHDLAKELGMESKELVDILKSKNIEAKGQSTLEDDVAAQIRKEAAGRKSAEKKEEGAMASYCPRESACLNPSHVRAYPQFIAGFPSEAIGM